jgi:hypothetical protein
MKLHRGSRTHNWVNRVHLWVLARKRVSLLAGSANRAAASQKRVFAQSHVFYVLEGTLLAQVSFTATHWWVEVVKNCAAERQSTAQTVILRSTLWKQKAEPDPFGLPRNWLQNFNPICHYSQSSESYTFRYKILKIAGFENLWMEWLISFS